MRTPVRHGLPAALAVLGLIAVLVAACTGNAASPTPQPTTPLVPDPTPVMPTPVMPTPVMPTPVMPSAGPDAQGFWLRLTTTQALPPVNLFGRLDPVVITGDGKLVTPGATLAIFPGPLVAPLVARQISDAGRAAIIKFATDLGLIGRQTDFVGGPPLAGGVMGHVQISIDGKVVELTGMPDMPCTTSPCNPAPATPEAFSLFWQRMLDLGWLGAELGPEAPYTPVGYSVLVGPAPVPEAGINPVVIDWPLADQLATMGINAGQGYRCATFTGAAVPLLKAAFDKANQLTGWNQDPQFSAAYGLTVVPLVPGQDACRDLFAAAS
jgi:hypothetical protein